MIMAQKMAWTSVCDNFGDISTAFSSEAGGKMALHLVMHACRIYKTSYKTTRWDAMRDT